MRRLLLLAGVLAIGGCSKDEAPPADAAAAAAPTALADAGTPDAAAADAAQALKPKDDEAAPKRAGPDEAWFVCKKPKDCVAVQDACKEPVAVAKKGKAAYAKWVKANPPESPCAAAKKGKKKAKPKLACEQRACALKK